ncbi:unnamed protein product [Pleuronectes platessa]|uniref:Uncharacterized protein n=1 Tax=Pleuronectes platessa TaxID=8262 RepID=A0A9N7UPR1_PLEPL|nr:unnamed protein product [Pleuronectes platessa]
MWSLVLVVFRTRAVELELSDLHLELGRLSGGGLVLSLNPLEVSERVEGDAEVYTFNSLEVIFKLMETSHSEIRLGNEIQQLESQLKEEEPQVEVDTGAVAQSHDGDMLSPLVLRTNHWFR